MLLRLHGQSWMRNTPGIDSGTDATPLGLGYPEYGVPRVAFALLPPSRFAALEGRPATLG